MNESLQATASEHESAAELTAANPTSGGHSYAIRIADEKLHYRRVTLTEPRPTGLQILTAAGFEPAVDFSLFAILPSGDFEDIRLDEQFDLQAQGAEEFIASFTDREFKLEIEDDQLRWGKQFISGKVLHKLAKAGPDESIYMDVAGPDRLIGPNELVDLSLPGTERFYKAPKTEKSFEILVNTRPKIVDHNQVTFEQVVALAFPGDHAPNVTFSMTFRHAASTPHAAELGEGGSVIVRKKGTKFNVTRTVQS